MGARKSKPNRNPFIMFTYSMMNSSAYKSLAASACKALPFFLAKVKLPIADERRYQEVFTLSYGELKAAACISDKTCSSVFQALVSKGFIDPVSKGGLRGNGMSFSRYRLSSRWEQYGQSAFEEIDLRKFGT